MYICRKNKKSIDFDFIVIFYCLAAENRQIRVSIFKNSLDNNSLQQKRPWHTFHLS